MKITPPTANVTKPGELIFGVCTVQEPEASVIQVPEPKTIGSLPVHTPVTVAPATGWCDELCT